jgi:CubicO group peptidase (beta-lactamase class C family)
MIDTRHRLAKTLCILLCVFSAASAQVPEKEKVIAAAERAFEKAAKTNPMPAPGCAIGVSLNGQPVFEKAFGLAEMEHNIPNTPQTIFESGSVAKQFTAAALVLLEQDGKLKIDDDVRKYIPELPDLQQADHDQAFAHPHRRAPRLGIGNGIDRCGPRQSRDHAGSGRRCDDSPERTQF